MNTVRKVVDFVALLLFIGMAIHLFSVGETTGCFGYACAAGWVGIAMIRLSEIEDNQND